ncbi:MAG: AMP-binding protein, partial [Candidatus Bathyarchaeia archaeon]
MATSYAVGPAETPLVGETIGECFERIVKTFPDNEALISRSQKLRFTYRELKKEVDRFARGLLHLGLGRGDRVGIWSPNNFEWIVAQFATPKIGTILVNINPAYRVAELEYALKQSGINTLILAPAFKKSNYIAMINDLMPEVKRSESSKLRISGYPELRHIIVLGDERHSGMYTWKDITEMASETTFEKLEEKEKEQQFDDPINIQYTSGTTGFPKGATLSHHNILNNAYFSGEAMKFSSTDRLCIPIPFYHCFGMVLSNLLCVTHGSTMILPSDSFSPETVLETVEQEKCTALHGVPTMFISELEHSDFSRRDLTSLRTGIMAGAPCPIEVMKNVVNKMGCREITIAYGMTETSPVSLQTRVDDPLELRVTTVGRVHPHVEAKIIDPETKKIVERGTPGELLVRGYLVMLGYWNNPSSTSESIDDARWMHTGDLAVMNDEGYVNIVGRSKDMISRAGEKVFPREVEEFLYTHPKISDAQLIGVPSSYYGEEVMAWIKLKEGEDA